MLGIDHNVNLWKVSSTMEKTAKMSTESDLKPDNKFLNQTITEDDMNKDNHESIDKESDEVNLICRDDHTKTHNDSINNNKNKNSVENDHHRSDRRSAYKNKKKQKKKKQLPLHLNDWNIERVVNIHHMDKINCVNYLQSSNNQVRIVFSDITSHELYSYEVQ
jgi:hypothetical protein